MRLIAGHSCTFQISAVATLPEVRSAANDRGRQRTRCRSNLREDRVGSALNGVGFRSALMRRWLLLSILIAGLVLLGLGTLRGEMLALAIPLLIYAGAALLGRPEPPQLSATRSFSAQRLASGEPAQVSVSIINL